jgi:NADPH:quinone reductase-like Zn-dependent oxidoreductase
VIIHEESAVKAPDTMSDEQASTLPIAALYRVALADGRRQNLQPGQTVVVQGTGGVSIFAALIATAHGDRVIASEKIKSCPLRYCIPSSVRRTN